MTKFTILFFIANITLLGQIQASELFCHTPRKAKCFKVSAAELTILEERGDQHSRALSSISNAETYTKNNSLTKKIKFEGHDYTIYVNDLSSPSEVNDYVEIKDPKGHKLLYSLSCSKI